MTPVMELPLHTLYGELRHVHEYTPLSVVQQTSTT